MDEPIGLELKEYWNIIVRKKWIVLISVVACIAMAGVLCAVLPKSYRSSTLILVENPKIPEAYVKDMGGGSIEERFTMIQQQVMSRTMLSQIIEEFQLYGSNKREGLESIIEGMRTAIKVETVGTTTGGGKSVEAFVISFAHEHPVTAMKVTAKLASQFIEKNTKVRSQLVTGVSTFLERELQAAKATLEVQEQAISRFKAKHIGLLPEQMEANLKSLDRLQTNLNTTDELLRNVTDRLGLVEKSIKEYEASGVTTSASGQTTSHAGLDPLVARLRELEKTLTSLQAEYTESYPDIGEAKKEIASVKKQLAAKYGIVPEREDGPVKTFDPYLRELMKQRDELRVEVTSVRDRRQRLAEQIKEFESRVEQTPSREQELMILIRDYKNMQGNYQSLLEKRLNAHVAENLEKGKTGEQFRIIDPANLPERAEKPNRLMIMLFGLLGGAGLGVSLAIGMERFNPTFMRREQVEMLPRVRVIGAIPNFSSLYDQLRQQVVDSFQSTELISGGGGARIGSKSLSRLSSENGKDSPSCLFNLIVKWQPLSLAAEQYRIAATRLLLLEGGRTSSVVTITSAVKGEGKTTTVVNLGYTLARDMGKQALLIDCDFRCPILHKYANVSAGYGLTELLDQGISLEECLVRIDENPCFILPVGKIKPDFNVNEFSKIKQLSSLLPSIRLKFDYVLINAPPVLPLATMNVLAGLGDVFVMVIRAGSTPKHAVEQAFSILRLTNDAHAILNAVEVKSMPSYIYGYSASHTDKAL